MRIYNWLQGLLKYDKPDCPHSTLRTAERQEEKEKKGVVWGHSSLHDDKVKPIQPELLAAPPNLKSGDFLPCLHIQQNPVRA